MHAAQRSLVSDSSAASHLPLSSYAVINPDNGMPSVFTPKETLKLATIRFNTV